MNGTLILVSGLSGAGKTTLIAGALKQMPELVYLRTFTTRPMRPGEENSHEYTFVSEQQYDELRQASKGWDHTEYAGYSYGADAEAVKQILEEGHIVICAVAPDMSIIDNMARLHGKEPTTIWIKTPKDVAKQRIYQDDIRDARNEDFAISTNFDYIFLPRGEVAEDVEAFVELLGDIIK